MHGGASTVKVVMLMGPSCHGGWLCGGGRGVNERKLMKGVTCSGGCLEATQMAKTIFCHFNEFMVQDVIQRNIKPR